jgi:hypothetical protein
MRPRDHSDRMTACRTRCVIEGGRLMPSNNRWSGPVLIQHSLPCELSCATLRFTWRQGCERNVYTDSYLNRKSTLMHRA